MSIQNKMLWAGAGVIAGFAVAALIGVVVIDMIIPWEDICAVLGPAQALAAAGASLLEELQTWLAQAESVVAAGKSESSSGLSGGLGGILSNAAGKAIDVIVAPVTALIDLAQAVVVAVQSAVEAAQSVMESVDAARCN